ncbi:ABC transporter permease [Dechloromonas denitrificans]|uniref:ABC transporter permease n=1 Tax=Dechloromonas denitrificans TaxID=281362 RepID=UPI0009F854EC|nr:ABC transporter permease [Dechloromonas denitrificans]
MSTENFPIQATVSSARQLWHEHDGGSDISVGLLASHVWLALGWHDIRQRYRRSVLGPFWFTLSTLIMVAVLGILYSTLLGQEITTYLPYLGIGLVVWQYLSACVNEGSTAFIGSAYLIKQIRMPLTVHVSRIVWRNFVILLHSLPVVVVFMFIFGHVPGPEFLLVVPGLVLLLLNGVWIGVVLGTLCARYRDVLPIVGNLIQIVFFFTPIMWTKDLLKDRAWVAELNPFHHMIDIVRGPIIGSTVAPESWLWSVGILVVGFLAAQYLMQRCRNRVPYWV